MKFWPAVEEHLVESLDIKTSSCDRIARAKEFLLHHDTLHGFRRWTIMDYHKAYVTGTITPTMVWP